MLQEIDWPKDVTQEQLKTIMEGRLAGKSLAASVTDVLIKEGRELSDANPTLRLMKTPFSESNPISQPYEDIFHIYSSVTNAITQAEKVTHLLDKPEEEIRAKVEEEYGFLDDPLGRTIWSEMQISIYLGKRLREVSPLEVVDEFVETFILAAPVLPNQESVPKMVEALTRGTERFHQLYHAYENTNSSGQTIK